MLRIGFGLGGPAVLLTAAVLACTEGGLKDPASENLSGLTAAGAPGLSDIGEFELCNHGPREIFRVIVNGFERPRFRLGPDACLVLATRAALGPGNHTVTVIEDVIHGTVFDSIVAESISVRDPSRVRSSPISPTPPEITETFNGDNGWLVDFYNH